MNAAIQKYAAALLLKGSAIAEGGALRECQPSLFQTLEIKKESSILYFYSA